MRILPIICIVITVLCSCSTSTLKNATSDIITIKLEEVKGKDQIEFSDFFKISKLIPLETSDNSLIGEIKNICIVNERIYVGDVISQAILVFDLAGKFLYKIDKQGKGEGEYTKLGNIQVVEDGRVIVYDSRTEKLITYSKEGDFLNEKKLPFYIDEFIELDSQRLLAYSDNGISKLDNDLYNAVVWNGKNVIAKSCKNNPRLAKQSFVQYNFNALKYFNDKIYLTETFGDTIYTVTKDRIVPIYKVAFPQESPKNEDIDYEYSQKHNRSINNLFENDTCIFFEYSKHYGIGAVLYSKKNKECKYLRSIRDLENGFYINLFPANGKHQFLVGLINPDRLIESSIWYKDNKIPETLQYLYNNVEITDNPILVFYELK